MFSVGNDILMTLNDLKTGDLIFFCNSFGGIDHIALFANYKDGIPYIIHAVTAPYFSVMLTSLNRANEKCCYLVVRPTQTDISLIATGILYRWVELQVPFASTEKRDAIVNKLDNMGGFDRPDAGKIQEPFGKLTYIENFDQYIEIANSLPFVPCKDGKAEGMFCSETIISAYNVATLISQVRAVEQMGHKYWSLDGHTSLAHFVAALDIPLPFDAKATLPAGIYEHCINDTKHWLNLGVLEVTADINDEIASGKGVWREFKSYLLADANEKVRACLRSPTNLGCEGGASPRRSPREQLLFFAPTGSIPLANRSSPICFLQELGDIKSDVSGNFVL